YRSIVAALICDLFCPATYLSSSCLSLLLFFFFNWSRTHPDLHSFPTRRSSDLVKVSVAEVIGEANESVRVPALKTILPPASCVVAMRDVSSVPESPLSLDPSTTSWSTALPASRWRMSSVRVKGWTSVRFTWISEGRLSPVDRYAIWLPSRLAKRSLGAPAAPGR